MGTFPPETIFSQDVADEICERIANGESLNTICADDRPPHIPHKSTVFRWLAKLPEFARQYAFAREAQADALFDEVLSIADDGRNDWMQRRAGDETRWVENGEAINRSRLRIDVRKWMAGKLRPKKYGERQTFDVDLTMRHEDALDQLE